MVGVWQAPFRETQTHKHICTHKVWAGPGTPTWWEGAVRTTVPPAPLDGISKAEPKRVVQGGVPVSRHDCLISGFALLEISSLEAEDCNNVGPQAWLGRGTRGQEPLREINT